MPRIPSPWLLASLVAAATVAASCCHTRPSVPAGPVQWRRVGLLGAPDDIAVVAVSGTTANDLWAVGNQNRTDHPFVFHFDGTNWLLDPISDTFPDRVHDVAALSPSDVWIAGANATVAHFDGTAWTTTVVGAAKTASQSVDRLHVWGKSLWGSDLRDHGAYYRFDGKDWVRETASGVPTQIFKSVWGSADDDIWVAGGHAAHFDGKTWAPTLEGHEPFEAVHGSSRTDVWMLASHGTSMSMWAHKANAFHYDGSTWTETPLPEDVLLLHSVFAVSRTEAYAVGDGADAVRWDGTAWHRMLTGIERSSGLPSLADVFCAKGGRPIAGGVIGPVILQGL